MASAEHVVLTVAGREVAISNPRQGAVSSGRLHQTGPRALLPRGRGRRAARPPAGGPTSSSAIRTASTASSSTRSARRRRGRRGSTWSRCAFRPAAARRKWCRAMPAALAVDGQSGLPRAAPAPGARRRSRSSRRAARRSRSGARRRRGRRSATSRSVVRDTLEEFGLVGWPKTSGSRGMHIYVRIERRWTFDEVRRAALALAREVERRAPGSGDEQVVEGGAPRRVPRLQPEREGSHDCRRLLGAADA